MIISTVFTSCIITGVLVFMSVVHAETVKGTPGIDYPNYFSIPKTSFSCSEQKYIPGFYADLETQCQAFHFCFKDGQESFLCPTGTIYNQETLSCDSWYNSNCSLAPLSYSINAGPAMENAGRNIPKLLKLRNRSQGRSASTSAPNIFEQISSLYEAGTDHASPEALETGDLNEASNSNASHVSSEVSEDGSETTENKNEELSENASLEDEENVQGDAGVDDETDETDELEYDSIEEGQDEEMDENLVYDPISNGYYMNYDPYQAEWQQAAEPTSDQFRSFYDYENFAGEYNTQQDGGDSSDESEMLDESFPEALDLNNVGEEADFFKRQLNVPHSPYRYRRRPMYVVVEDDEESEDEDPGETDDYLGDEPGLESSAEDADTDIEAGTEIPVKSADETLEGSDGSQSDSETATSVPSEHEQIYDEESHEDASTDFQSDQFVTADDYEPSFRSFGAGEETAYDQGIYEDSEGNSWYQTVAPEASDEDKENTFVVLPEDTDDDSNYSSDPDDADNTEDTFLVLPDETNDGPDSNSDYAYQDGTVDEDSANEGVYEDDERTDEDILGDEGYDPYQDAYEYYRSHREFPDGYEAVESGSFQGSDYNYLRHYGGQYIPRQEYEDDGEYEDDYDYSNYNHEEARRAYMSSLRNSQMTDEESYYARQKYQPTRYMDSDYGEDSGYYRDGYSQNYDDENSDYYATDESGEYYSQSDAPWAQQDSTEDSETDDQLGVTDVPLPVDVTAADLVNLEENGSSVELEENEYGEELEETTPEDEDKKQETFYVFDFDEEGDIKDDESTLNMDGEGLESDFNKSPDLEDALEMDSYHSSDSISNDSTSFYKDDSEISSESRRAEDVGLDPFLYGQTGNAKLPDPSSNSGAAFNMKPLTDSWSPYVTESSQFDKPVTISSALERLAALNAVQQPQASSVGNLDFSSDSGYMSNMAFPGSMDFGPYGYGAGFGQQYGMLDSLQPSTQEFSHRTGEDEQPKVPKLSSIQEKLRSMKRGKFGVFKKYMSTIKNPKL